MAFFRSGGWASVPKCEIHDIDQLIDFCMTRSKLWLRGLKWQTNTGHDQHTGIVLTTPPSRVYQDWPFHPLWNIPATVHALHLDPGAGPAVCDKTQPILPEFWPPYRSDGVLMSEDIFRIWFIKIDGRYDLDAERDAYLRLCIGKSHWVAMPVFTA